MFEKEILDFGFIESIHKTSYVLEFKDVSFYYILSGNNIYYECWTKQFGQRNLSRQNFIEYII